MGNFFSSRNNDLNDLCQRLDTLDQNQDGYISRDEYQSWTQRLEKEIIQRVEKYKKIIPCLIFLILQRFHGTNRI